MVADVDFAYVYDGFQEIYAAAGRAVAVEWSRVRCIVQPRVLNDPVQAAAVLPSLANVRAVDTARRSHRQAADSKRLAEEPVRRELTTRFAALIRGYQMAEPDQAGSAEECEQAARRRAARLVKASEVTTMQRAFVIKTMLPRRFVVSSLSAALPRASILASVHPFAVHINTCHVSTCGSKTD